MEKICERKVYDTFGDSIKCKICPTYCSIALGELGKCRSKINKNGKLYSTNYGETSFVSVDLIERVPLYHFFPSSFTVSVAGPFCNFSCPWCTNWYLTNVPKEEIPLEEVSSEFIVNAAKKFDCKTVCFNYTEPTIWYDYVREVANAVHKEGLPIVLNTNGYMTQEVLEGIIPCIDAANIDIKSFSEEFYEEYCGGSLKTVLETAKVLKEHLIHVEASHLLIPSYTDNPDEYSRLYRWIRENLGAETPLHIGRFFPHYKFKHVATTPQSSIEKAWETASKEGLFYIYTAGIVEGDTLDTYCPNCGNRVVHRLFSEVLGWELTEDNSCKKCGEKIPIIGKKTEGRKMKLPPCDIDWDAGAVPFANLTHAYLGKVGKLGKSYLTEMPEIKDRYQTFDKE